jgi:hypothetical protein
MNEEHLNEYRCRNFLPNNKTKLNKFITTHTEENTNSNSNANTNRTQTNNNNTPQLTDRDVYRRKSPVLEKKNSNKNNNIETGGNIYRNNSNVSNKSAKSNKSYTPLSSNSTSVKSPPQGKFDISNGFGNNGAKNILTTKNIPPTKNKLPPKIHLIDYNPSKIGKFLKNKFAPSPGLKNKKFSHPSISTNCSLIELVKKEEEMSRSRNEKNKKIQKLADSLYKRKTFSMDFTTKDQIKKAIDENRLKKEMEECTFKPRINRNAKSNLGSDRNSQINSYNSKSDNEFYLTTNTYDRLTTWKSQVKSK